MDMWGKYQEGFVGSTFPRFTVTEAQHELGTVGHGTTFPLVGDRSLWAGFIERSCNKSREARTKTSGNLRGDEAGLGEKDASESSRREAHHDEHFPSSRRFEPRSYKTVRQVSRGDVVAIERPLVAMQLSAAMPWVIACPGCLRHVGNLDLQLAVASGACFRAQALEYLCTRSSAFGATVQEEGPVLSETDEDNQGEPRIFDHLPVVPGLSERFSQVMQQREGCV